jgi:hypothetical protein
MVLFGVVKHECVDLALELFILNISKYILKVSKILTKIYMCRRKYIV